MDLMSLGICLLRSVIPNLAHNVFDVERGLRPGMWGVCHFARDI
jgi:hypothetical protein